MLSAPPTLDPRMSSCAFGYAHVVRQRKWGSANDFLAALVRYKQVLAQEDHPACAREHSDEQRRDCNVTAGWEEVRAALEALHLHPSRHVPGNGLGTARSRIERDQSISVGADARDLGPPSMGSCGALG